MSEIKMHKEIAAREYGRIRKLYDLARPSAIKECIKVMKAELTVYAGVHNRDYAQYKKGVDAFEKSIKAPALYSKPFVKVGHDGVMSDVMDGSDGCDHEEINGQKLLYYKDMYNVLPRGYFRSV